MSGGGQSGDKGECLCGSACRIYEDHWTGTAVQQHRESAAALRREHLFNHLTDGRFHGDCEFCLHRRRHGGTGIVTPPATCAICGGPINEVGTSLCYEAHGVALTTPSRERGDS